MKNQVIVVELDFKDKAGIDTSVWAVYFAEHLIRVEYTVGKSGLTNFQDFEVCYPKLAVA